MYSKLKNHFNYYLYILFILSQILLINTSTPTDIKRRIQNEIESLNNDELLEKILKSGGLSDCDSDYCYQISYIDSQYVKNQEKKFPQIILTDKCIKSLINIYEASNLIITKIFIKNSFTKDSNNYNAGIIAISDIIFYQIFPYTNKKIVLSTINPEFSCGRTIYHYNPLYLKNTSLKKKILDVIPQNPNSDDINKLKDYDIFDSSSKFYNDVCTPASFIKYDIQETENLSIKNFDMTLNQRRINYYPGNVQLCPDDCTYLGIDQKTLSALCQCLFEDFSSSIKKSKEYSYLNESNDDSFYTKKKDTGENFNIIKCTKIAFSIKELKNNYGSYTMAVVGIMLLIYYIILMCYKNNHIISLLYSVSYDLKEEDKMKFNKANKKSETNTERNEIKSENSIDSGRSKISESQFITNKVIEIKGKNELNLSESESKEELKAQYEKKLKEIINQKDKEIKQIIKNKNEEIIQLKESKRTFLKKSTNIQMRGNTIQFELQPQILDVNHDIGVYKSKSEPPEEIIPLEAKFSNEEINNMDFDSCIAFDKRNICQIYGSYLTEKHPLIFLFNCNSPSSITTYTKLIIFIQRLMIYLLVFSLLFGTDTITKIYKENFDFIDKIFLSSYRTIIVMILNSFIFNLTYNTFYQKVSEIKILFYNSTLSSKAYFMTIKDCLNSSSIDSEYNKENKNPKIVEEEKAKKAISTLTQHLFKYFRDKLLISFFIVILWIFAEWYIVTVFYAVYKNSQIEFFEIIVFSFLISCVIPFIYCLFLAILRKLAIAQNSKCFYYVSKIFRIF